MVALEISAFSFTYQINVQICLEEKAKRFVPRRGKSSDVSTICFYVLSRTPQSVRSHPQLLKQCQQVVADYANVGYVCGGQITVVCAVFTLKVVSLNSYRDTVSPSYLQGDNR